MKSLPLITVSYLPGAHLQNEYHCCFFRYFSFLITQIVAYLPHSLPLCFFNLLYQRLIFLFNVTRSVNVHIIVSHYSFCSFVLCLEKFFPSARMGLQTDLSWSPTFTTHVIAV